MEIIKIDIKTPSISVIKKAANVLLKNGLVIYPTDTAYGLGANALSEDSIRKIYNVKFRDFSKPTHIVVRDWKMIQGLTHASQLAQRFYEKFLPGPLTLILPKKKMVPDILTGGLPTVGIRIPDNEVAKKLSHQLPFPYTTPSANKSGGIAPYSIEEVKKELDISSVDLILDGGKLPNTPPSTIVDLLTTSPKILREGSISKTKIIKTLGNVAL